jgi:hypothetical protein
MKQDILYPYYLIHLNDMLDNGKISNGHFSLLKISGIKFSEFKYKCENDTLFYTMINRDKKISELIENIR